MIRRSFIHLLAVALCGLSMATAAPAKKAGLRPGESLRYDEELKITFVKVASDSRCPKNAVCFWAGDAEVVLRIVAGNQKPKTLRLHTALKPRELVVPANEFPPGTAGIPKSYVISIASLAPQPVAGKKTGANDYRLNLNIGVAQ